jgi:hypothetical protein
MLTGMLFNLEAADALALVMTRSRSCPFMQLTQAVERQFGKVAYALQICFGGLMTIRKHERPHQP